MENNGFKRLGDYVREVDVRNTDSRCDKLVGLTISKAFIPSVANTIGTDLSKYKIISENQFACSLMQVSRDRKIPVAIYKGEDAIMSPAYPIFEVCSHELLPDYLQLWFSREEFDREATFYAIGGVRGSLDWDDFMDMRLPIPSISEQKRIVSQYKAIEGRKNNNACLINELEGALKCLFSEKVSSFLSHETIPSGWTRTNLPGIAGFLNGVACQKYESTDDTSSYPVIKIREMGIGNTDGLSDRVSTLIPQKYIISKGDLLFSWSASLSVDVWCGEKGALNQHIFKVLPKGCPTWFCYFWIKHYLEQWTNFISAKATSMGHIKKEDLFSAAVVLPSSDYLNNLDKQMNPLFGYLIALKREQLLADELKKAMLVKLSN